MEENYKKTKFYNICFFSKSLLRINIFIKITLLAYFTRCLAGERKDIYKGKIYLIINGLRLILVRFYKSYTLIFDIIIIKNKPKDPFILSR